MQERLNIHVPCMVMEGIAPERDTDMNQKFADCFSGERYVLYTGTLNYEFGIATLLDAFSKIEDSNLKLIICGFGGAESAITESPDKRIVYLGKVDRRQALTLQRNATVLVNPRQNNNEFTKYSFPSKTMEYLASGVPVVAYKLDGIPDEYDNYLNYVPDNSPETLATVIQNICQMSEEERKKMGARAKRFVMEEKNARIQTKRILDFLADGE